MVHVWSQRTSAEVSSAFLPCSAGTESGRQAWHLLLYLPSRLAAHFLHAFLSFSTKLNNIPVFRFITINLTWFLLLLICVAFNFLMFKIRLNHGLCILDPNRGSVHTFFFFSFAGLGTGLWLCQAHATTELYPQLHYLKYLLSASSAPHWGSHPRPCMCQVNALPLPLPQPLSFWQSRIHL